jgi:hypothetical protein
VSALRAAERYVRAGFCVVPIPHRSKRPVLEGWESLRLTPDELPEHFNGRPQNVGLILGQPSGGLVDVDQDAPEAAKIAGRSCHPRLPAGVRAALIATGGTERQERRPSSTKTRMARYS